MRSLSALATLLLGLAVVFWAPAAKADCPHNGNDTHQHCSGGTTSTSNEFRFIGFTNEVPNDLADTIAADQGMILMHALCQDDFGLDARMCTSEEFWLSPNAEAPTSVAWLHSVTQAGSDFTGAPTSSNCTGWSDSGAGLGYVVTTDGKPLLVSCGNVLPVTCCAPIQ